MADAVQVKDIFSKYLEKAMPLQKTDRNKISINFYNLLVQKIETEADVMINITKEDLN